MEKVVGNCGKHPGFNMVNCPMCEIEKTNPIAKEHKEEKIAAIYKFIRDYFDAIHPKMYQLKFNSGVNIDNVVELIYAYTSTPTIPVTEKQESEKDLIIHGLEEGAEKWKAEYDNCRYLLQELVDLKRIKDTEGKTPDYEQRQPKVWEAAREFLKDYQHQ